MESTLVMRARTLRPIIDLRYRRRLVEAIASFHFRMYRCTARSGAVMRHDLDCHTCISLRFASSNAVSCAPALCSRLRMVVVCVATVTSREVSRAATISSSDRTVEAMTSSAVAASNFSLLMSFMTLSACRTRDSAFSSSRCKLLACSSRLVHSSRNCDSRCSTRSK